jgi:hypothetical protein
MIRCLRKTEGPLHNKSPAELCDMRSCMNHDKAATSMSAKRITLTWVPLHQNRNPVSTLQQKVSDARRRLPSTPDHLAQYPTQTHQSLLTRHQNPKKRYPQGRPPPSRLQVVVCQRNHERLRVQWNSVSDTDDGCVCRPSQSE